MQALAPYKSRKHSVITLADGKEYKIPNEYTVEEVERLLELRVEIEALESRDAEDATLNRDNVHFKAYLDLVFAQLTIIFQHYQPEVTTEYLKSVVTQNEALEMLGFFQKYRHIALREITADKEQAQSQETEVKKKLAKTELRDLRRLIAFMVVRGFSLSDIRKLYVDEMHSYYEQMFYILEKMGEVKEGSYAKLMSKSKGGKVDAATQLRKQMLTGIFNRNKPKQ